MRTFAFRVGCGFLGAILAAPILVVIAVEIEDAYHRRNKVRIDRLMGVVTSGRAS